MDNTFTRSLIGFIVLTIGLAGMSLVALRALNDYAGAPWWAMLLIVIIALVAEISVYASTLHEPIHDWIREPKRRRDRESAELTHRRNGYNLGYEDGREGRPKREFPG